MVTTYGKNVDRLVITLECSYCVLLTHATGHIARLAGSPARKFDHF